jgi:hypothetical protein
VIDFVLRAFRATSIADLGTKLANAFREFRAACHLTLRQGTDVSATAIKFDAASHHLDVIFVQTCRRTMFTFNEAVVARLDAILVLFVSHGVFLGSVLISIVWDPPVHRPVDFVQRFIAAERHEKNPDPSDWSHTSQRSPGWVH